MVQLATEPRAYQWALPEGLKVPPDDLQVRLDFYQNAVMLYLIDRGVITTRMVSARDIALALLREIPLNSGLLPEGTLWWGQGKQGTMVALWRPARVWKVALQLEAFKPPRRFTIPMPGLIFVCAPGRPPRVYAAKHRPKLLDEPIYYAPLFNVFRYGGTCQGTHKYPETVEEIPESFFTSFFTIAADYRDRSKKYPTNLLKLWEELDGKKRYPLSDLIPCGTVKDILK